MVTGFTVTGRYHICLDDTDGLPVPGNDSRIQDGIMKDVRLPHQSIQILDSGYQLDSESDDSAPSVACAQYQEGDFMCLNPGSGILWPVLVTSPGNIKDKKQRNEVLLKKPRGDLHGVPAVLVCHYYDQPEFFWVDQPFYDLFCYGLYPQLRDQQPVPRNEGEQVLLKQAWARAQSEWDTVSWEEQDRQMIRHARLERHSEGRLREIMEHRAGEYMHVMTGILFSELFVSYDIHDDHDSQHNYTVCKHTHTKGSQALCGTPYIHV
jgi:hypothetical protein